MSDTTFDLLRHVQPFNAKPDHLSNVLWWLDELARIDRHRYGHALAPHIDRVHIGVRPPLTKTRDFIASATHGGASRRSPYFCYPTQQ